MSAEDMRFRAYDKLWENIIHKENRLWTFLAIYGAAVGYIVSQGSGDSQVYRNPAYAVVLLLTYWAAEIIIDSDWWSVRNRLMIGGIEREHKDALTGVIPERYNRPGYRGESLHTASIIVVTSVGVVSYFVAMDRVFEKIDSENAMAGWSGVLFIAAALAIVRCVHMREKRVREYFTTLRDLNAQRKRFDESEIDAAERRDVRELGRRKIGFVLYLFCLITLLVHTWSEMGVFTQGLIVLAQLLLLAIYMQQHRLVVQMEEGCAGFSVFFPDRKDANYLRPERYVCRNRWMLVLLIFTALMCVSAVATLPVWLQT